jgi:predicted transcriptional regulator
VPAASEEPAPGYRTAAEDKLWAALHANPDNTAAELAHAAGIGRSTAGKILARWGGEGSVTRTSTPAEGGRRSADRWAIADTDIAPDPDSGAAEEPAAPRGATGSGDVQARLDPDLADQSTVDEPVEPRDSTVSVDAVTHAPVSGGGRLAPGALRGQVEDFLTDHPNQEFTPGDISRKLHRSAGAIANALVKLTDQGVAELVCERPKKYRAVVDTEN